MGLKIAPTSVPLCSLACKDHADSGPTRVAVGFECRRVKCLDDCVDAFGDGNRVCRNPLRHHSSRVSNLSKRLQVRRGEEKTALYAPETCCDADQGCMQDFEEIAVDPAALSTRSVQPETA